MRQRTLRIVLDKSNERRSRNTGHCSSPINERASSDNTWGGTGSPRHPQRPTHAHGRSQPGFQMQIAGAIGGRRADE